VQTISRSNFTSFQEVWVLVNFMGSRSFWCILESSWLLMNCHDLVGDELSLAFYF
jgi:hypothetical protein